MANKTIYELSLHEKLIIDHSQHGALIISEYVIRVPGGWIYTHSRFTENQATETSVFVPFNEEFIQ